MFLWTPGYGCFAHGMTKMYQNPVGLRLVQWTHCPVISQSEVVECSVKNSCVCVSLYIPVQYYFFLMLHQEAVTKSVEEDDPLAATVRLDMKWHKLGISHWFIDVKHINIPRVLQNLAASQCAWCWVWQSRALTRQKHKQEVTQKKASDAVCGGWRRNRYYSCFNAVQLLFDCCLIYVRLLFSCCSVC